jgi:3D (Asp-Asp-Asp) domain-containing protein
LADRVKRVEYKTFVATAYSLKGKTASGDRTRHGIIAADRRVLPLGTKVHIQGMGEYTVKDTGGAIKGNRIDIWMPSRKAAMQFGRRKVQVKIIR